MTQNSSGITFIDLNAQQSKITKKKIQSRINNVLSHGQYIMGPEVAQFETELQKFTPRLRMQYLAPTEQMPFH